MLMLLLLVNPEAYTNANAIEGNANANINAANPEANTNANADAGNTDANVGVIIEGTSIILNVQRCTSIILIVQR